MTSKIHVWVLEEGVWSSSVSLVELSTIAVYLNFSKARSDLKKRQREKPYECQYDRIRKVEVRG